MATRMSKAPALKDVPAHQREALLPARILCGATQHAMDRAVVQRRRIRFEFQAQTIRTSVLRTPRTFWKTGHHQMISPRIGKRWVVSSGIRTIEPVCRIFANLVRKRLSGQYSSPKGNDRQQQTHSSVRCVVVLRLSSASRAVISLLSVSLLSWRLDFSQTPEHGGTNASRHSPSVAERHIHLRTLQTSSGSSSRWKVLSHLH